MRRLAAPRKRRASRMPRRQRKPMYCSQAFRLFTGCFLVGAGMVCFSVSSMSAGSAGDISSDQSLYHADREHLWNRLHEALFIRVGPDGRAYGQDRLEPLLWPHSKHLLEERTHRRAIAVLEEFLENDGEKLIEDPLKRALLQWDLWLAYNWIDGDHSDFAEPQLTPDAALTAQQRLHPLLAAAIGRLALSAQEIRDLPDNYAAAVASGHFARRFNPERPDQPYLPPELFAADGPWLCLGRSDSLTAPQHLREDGSNRFTNSVFLVFLRLPAGRAATADYLQQLRRFDQPLLVHNPEDSHRASHPFVPNLELPQFPKGTEIALVRRALLIDSSQRIAAAPLTESVQLRVLHGDVPASTPEVLNDAFRSSAASRERIGLWQSFHEVRLSRALLFAERAGGLRAVGSDERDFKTGFNAHPWDEFERPLRADQAFPTRNQQVGIIENCFACHGLPGVYSFNSLQDFRSGITRDGDKLRPFPLAEMSVSQVSDAAVKWKEGQPNWTSLRRLLAK